MASCSPPPLRGRGASDNPKNRFERLEIALDPEVWDDPDEEAPPTRFYNDTARTIIARNSSPDIGFETSINPYRGCEHGCSYCFARPTHEFLGLSADLDFERKILVKTEAPALLRRELSARSWVPQPIAMSGVTDVYQPVERRLELTRRRLEVLLDFRNPATIVTKNALIERDLDLLRALAAFDGVSVALSVTTLDEGLRGLLEPRTSTAANRLGAVRALAEAGVHVGVLTAPIIPGLTDHEIPRLLEAAKGAGARFVGYNVVHLPYGTKELFATWLRQHRPERAERVLARIRDVRGGRLNDPRFGYRMRGEGAYAEQIAQLFRAARRRAGFERSGFRLSSERFRVPGRAVQPGLFDAA